MGRLREFDRAHDEREIVDVAGSSAAPSRVVHGAVSRSGHAHG